jgi:hypothetical protein
LPRPRPWNVAIAGRLRALTVLEAAERAALTPIPAQKLHALAYLSDVLSPVWGLSAFDPVALKTGREPFFGRFQDELDDLIILGFLEVTTFDYGGSTQASSETGVQLNARYQLRYASEALEPLIVHIRNDEELGVRLDFFVALASAIGRLPDEAIAAAITKDAAWDNADVPTDDVVEFSTVSGARSRNRTDGTIDVFEKQSPGRKLLEPAAKLRLYTAFLAERLRVA